MQYLKQKHIDYLNKVKLNRDSFSFNDVLRDHLNLPGAYWSITSCYLIGLEITDSEKKDLIDWVLSCQNEDKGFGGNTGHDSSVTCTLYALIILMLFDRTDLICKKEIGDYAMSLYDESTGAFKGDKFGEIDGRFVYSAVYILKIVRQEIPEKCIDFFKLCHNYDGGFGGTIDAESHAAYIFCSVGALSIMNKIDHFSRNNIKKLLSLRQTSSGGFNGRPEKLPDVCYSWWVLASMGAIGDINNVDIGALEKYIISCQDEQGGFSDRPGNDTDVFHTFFALAALSLIDHEKYELKLVDPVYAIPVSVREAYLDK